MIKLIKSEFIKNYNLKNIIIILVILLISSFLLIKFEETFGNRVIYDDSYSYLEEDYKYMLQQFEENYEKNPNDFNKDLISIAKEIHENYKITRKNVKGHHEMMWQKNFTQRYITEVSHKYALMRLDDCEHDEITDYILGYENPGLIDTYHNIKESYMDYLDSYKNANYEGKKEEVNNKIKQLDKIIKDNYYYKYMEYHCDTLDFNSNNRLEDYCNYIIKNKIKNEYDYRVVNASEYLYLNDLKNSQHILNRKGNEYTNTLNNNIKTIFDKQEKIVGYAYKHEMKHDLKFPYDSDYIGYSGHYINTKNYVNKGLSLGFVICFILVILNSGIISREHDKGTIKLLLTAPVKREKVLLSKFLYLIINMYLLWILGIFFIFIISGMKYGFSDLFINQIVLINNNATEMNYFIWYIGKLFIHSIPVICFLSFMFFLSTTFKNTVFTSSVCSVFTLLSLLIWVILDNLKIKVLYLISYTPLAYLDFNIIRENNRFYINTISNTNLTSAYGIIISIICTIIFLLISISYYKKIDIVNK